VVGLGNIGRQIAKRASAFDMRVIAVDADDVPKPDYVAQVARLDALDSLLGSADVVAVATPLTPQTRKMIGAAQLALMKPEAYLLVVSRGGIVDERALAAALKEGQFAGAGLDVSETEPLPPESPLWDVPNLLFTPHCSGSSRQTTEGAWRVFAENVGRFVRGEPLENVVDKKRGY
jgi:phosphoglycerate dehydrogenase-like enzyme